MVALDWKKAMLPVINMIRPSWYKKLPAVVSFVLLIAIAYQMTGLTWMLIPGVEQQSYVDNKPVVNKGGSVVSASGASGISDIARWHLFGKPGATPVAPPPVKQEVVQETKLRLELKGILSSPDPKFARAIISEPPRNEDTYGVGASLPGGATLVEINADHVVLTVRGRREKLSLPREIMQSASAAPSASSRSSRPSNSSRTNRRNVNRQTNSSSSRSSTNRQSGSSPSRSVGGLSELRDALNNDPQSLLGLIDAKPEIVNGQVTGFKLDNMQNDRLLRRFGLRRGDVVTAVNGIQLNATANLPQLLNELKSAEQVKIEYKRRGRPRSVVLNMDE